MTEREIELEIQKIRLRLNREYSEADVRLLHSFQRELARLQPGRCSECGAPIDGPVSAHLALGTEDWCQR